MTNSRKTKSIGLGLRQTRRLLSVGFLLGALALIAAGANWLQVSLENVAGQEKDRYFTGFESFGYVLPLILVYLAGLLFVSITQGKLRGFGSIITLAAAAVLLTLWSIDFSSQDISGITASLEKATGVTGSAIENQIDVTFLSMALISGALFGLMIVTALIITVERCRVEESKQKKSKRASAPKGTQKDSISLWDNQG
ncbi:MAG: hypothetical protein F2544_00180 [Actinobacteria bacterium]|nr:hypothetical protein [Actinomycetota bacterium]MSZ22803.1 hypothetical protein [Actinomycetota bacterium]MTA91785.1 hypothetical protein [Actinomycetota bacterium]